MLQKKRAEWKPSLSLAVPRPLQSHIKRSAPGPGPDNCTPIVLHVEPKQWTKEKMEARKGENRPL